MLVIECDSATQIFAGQDVSYLLQYWMMTRFSTREAAKKLGISHDTLANYIEVGKVPKPETVRAGKRNIHLWTEQEIEHVRRLLPKIANGRKTRWQRAREGQTGQAKVPVPYKKKSTKKKK